MVRRGAGIRFKHVAALATLGLLACGGSHKEPAVAPEAKAGAPPPAAQAKGAYIEGQPAKPSEKLERDPQAISALRRMGRFLLSLREFKVSGHTSTDEVLETGQKLQFDQAVELRVRRPDRLTADVQSDRKHRRMYYDGKTFTLFAPRLGYYAQADAPPTIDELIRAVQDRFGISMPLADLFYWGTEESDEAAILGAIDVGPSRVRGADTEHYAYRLSDVDFQVWIQKGDQPLPRKLVITTTEEPSEPQHAMMLDWDLTPELAASEFTFTPPPGAHRIVFEEQKF